MENENMRNIKNYKDGFSLIEMLLALLLASAIIVIAATSIAKHNVPKKREGVVYTYSPENNTTTDNLCYETVQMYASFSTTYKKTRNCSEYTFTVPEDVHLVNLTLVGGGGGGASSGETDVNSRNNRTNHAYGYSYSAFYTEDNIDIKIDYLTARGETGSSDVTTSGDTFISGAGGKSSPVIHDFKVPRTCYLPSEFPLMGYRESSELMRIIYNGNTANDDAYIRLTPHCGYFVKSSGTYGCLDSAGEETDDLSVCGLDADHVVPSTLGQDGVSKAVSDLYPNMIIEGGVGGKNSYTQKYGFGGQGASLKVSCIPTSNGKCDTANYTPTAAIHRSPISNKPMLISFTLKTSKIQGIGAGGASGTVARIVDFPVTPGETYKIVVGAGGAGGKGGRMNLASDGTGGVSTAIFDSSNNLIFMTIGGAGGKTGTSFYNSLEYYGGRGSAALFYNNIAPNLDTKIANSVTCPASTNEYRPANYMKTACLKYSALENEPYATINLNGNTEADNDNFYGGFTNFLYSSSSKTPSNLNYLTADGADIYDGFYYRRILDNVPAYIGGLGGFSGFGGKAACGAYFMGNYDALDKDGNKLDDSIRKKYLNKMAVNDNWYEVSKYYEGCNTNSSDGATVDFVAPDPVKLNYGVAGLGGGGAGYHPEKGVGNGGDGQNGYLMIDWKR